MIKSFKCNETETIWSGETSTRLPQNIQNVARRKLRMLNNAIDLNDLLNPPANRLEALAGNRKGQHSTRINQQCRICFIWDQGASYVEIVDYH